MALKVLAVMPTVKGLPALAWSEELLQLVETPDVELTPLPGLIRKERLGAWLRSALWDVVIWIGHGLPGQLLLANETVEARWLASQMRGHVRLAVLSVCESDGRPANPQGLVTGFADELPAAGVALVAMTVAIDDRSAVQFDVALVQALASGDPAWRAHQVALEAISRSAMVQAPRYYEAIMTGDFRTYGQQADTQRLVFDLVARVGVVEAKVSGIAEDVSEMRGEMRDVRAELKAYAPSARPQVALPRELVALATAGALVTTLLLMFIAWKLV